jgi:hypothetical protein
MQKDVMLNLFQHLMESLSCETLNLILPSPTFFIPLSPWRERDGVRGRVDSW